MRGNASEEEIQTCFELTLAPSFPGAPSGPFCPLSPCQTKEEKHLQQKNYNNKQHLNYVIPNYKSVMQALKTVISNVLCLPWLLGYRRLLSPQAYLADQGVPEIQELQRVRLLPEKNKEIKIIQLSSLDISLLA